MTVLRLLSVICIGFILSTCNDQASTYYDIRAYTDEIRVINTHEHQHNRSEYETAEFNLYHLLRASYLRADISSSGMEVYPDSIDRERLWDTFGRSLEYTRSTSYYSQLMAGFRKLYDFRDPYLTQANIDALSRQVEKNYQHYDQWFDQAFRKAGFELMFIDQYWKPLNTEIDTMHFALAFNINFLISGASRRPLRLPGSVDTVLPKNKKLSLDDYLETCNDLFKRNVEKNAVCIKNSQAYSRTLYYEDVPYGEAATLFQKDMLTPAEAKKIEDFIFHYVIKKATEHNLPVQIHTGYLAGNGGMLDNGQPVKLNNLFLKYPDARFVLFHGGFPWTGECAALAKMFPNVYLDLVWLPQISRQEAVNALDIILDCVPYNKLCWGGDCQLIEESAGALEFAKDVVSEVLSLRVKRGLMAREVAFEVASRIFRENAIEIFGL